MYGFFMGAGQQDKLTTHIKQFLAAGIKGPALIVVGEVARLGAASALAEEVTALAV